MTQQQSRADDLAQAKAADTESSADRAAREALVRRLDNERQYLKSQLQSEITCKDELREALATATRQLGEIKVRYHRDRARSAGRLFYTDFSLSQSMMNSDDQCRSRGEACNDNCPRPKTIEIS